MLPISEKHAAYGQEIHQKLLSTGIRSVLDEGSEKIGYKIREAQLKKIPYMLILGEKESEAGVLTVRRRDGENVNEISLDRFLTDEFFPRPDLS